MVGEKKSKTTNLDFPSVLLNQGLEPTTKRRKLLPHKEEEKRGKTKRTKERKRDSYCD